MSTFDNTQHKIKIEAGKHYRRADGEKVGPALWRDELGGYFVLEGWHYNESGRCGFYGKPNDIRTNLHIVAEWTDEPETQPDTPKLLRDMTELEQLRLKVAFHEGKTVQVWSEGIWVDDPVAIHNHLAYRIRPEPKRETVTLYSGKENTFDWDVFNRHVRNAHRMTFDLIDGKPDCASIRMKELNSDEEEI